MSVSGNAGLSRFVYVWTIAMLALAPGQVQINLGAVIVTHCIRHADHDQRSDVQTCVC